MTKADTKPNIFSPLRSICKCVDFLFVVFSVTSSMRHKSSSADGRGVKNMAVFPICIYSQPLRGQCINIKAAARLMALITGVFISNAEIYRHRPAYRAAQWEEEGEG